MKNDEMDNKLQNIFDDLQDIPPRDPQAASRGRANFLKQAATLRRAVSRKADRRLSGWMNTIKSPFQRKERLPMLNTLIAVILAVAVLFGGSGATVYAAQDSLPDQALYQVKTWSEDAVLSLTGSPQARLQYALKFSERRVEEMAGLLAAGKPIPEAVETRLRNQLDLALKLAVGLDDPQMIQQLEQIRLRAEAQLQTVTRLRAGAPQSEEPLLTMAQTRLREQIQLAAEGEMDPQELRLQIQQRTQQQEAQGTQTPGAGQEQQGPGPLDPSATPGQYGPGPLNPSATPQRPGSGGDSGSGGNTPTGTPGGYGPGSPSQTPQPGSGTGNGP